MNKLYGSSLTRQLCLSIESCCWKGFGCRNWHDLWTDSSLTTLRFDPLHASILTWHHRWCGNAGLKNRYQVIDPTLRGLLLPPSQYENGKCVSRLEESMLRRPSPYEPSPHLITKLREYEDRHRRCASKAKKFDKDGPNSRKILGDCQFVVWIANSGLGNRMITIMSAFVYALLTDRVLLLDHSRTDIGGLFCEPFPSTSWLLPEGYDYAWMDTLIWENNNRLGHLLQMAEGGFENVTDVPPNNYVFLNLMHDYDDHDKRFFCKKVQKYLKKVPLLYFRSNNYVVPGLHFVEDFHVELDKMFPERETTFHHMIRYLFRPSNLMWGLILRFRQPYLAGAERQVGLQVRILESNVTMPVVADQVSLRFPSYSSLIVSGKLCLRK